VSDPRDFDELSAAWNELEPPTSAPEPDAQTRATIDWLKAAFEDLEPPAPALPAWVRASAGRRPFVRRLGALAAAAAILALAFGARALVGGGEGGAPRSPELVSRAERHEPHDPISEAPLEPRAPVVQAAFRTDGIELRSGNVRLILLDAHRKAPTHTLTENPTDQENAR